MNARQFVAEFGHIANAPGGIAQLRQMIYQLAITGSITPRDEEGSDAQVLLRDIEATRQRLIHEKSYKRMLELERESIRVPAGIEIPTTWCWTRLLDIGEINPRNDAQDDDLAAFLPMSGVSQLHRGAVVTDTTKWSEIKKGYTHFASGDVVLAKITPCFENGKAAVIPAALSETTRNGAGTTELHVFRTIHGGVLPEYVYLFLRSPLFTVEGEKNMTGTAGQKRLPTDYFATRACPLPPTEEQSRIVAKVDELMALCDKLEAQQQERRTLQNALRRSTLQAVVAATSPHELHTTWTRLAENFGRLFQAPEDVAELEQSVKQLVLRGLLSVHEPGEQVPADLSELSSTSVAAVNEVEMDWHIPGHWIWARSEWLGEARLGKMLDAAKNRGEFRPYLRNVNVRWRRFDLADVLKMRVEDHELKRISVQRGDLVICEGGEPGRAAIWDLDAEYIIQKALHRFRCNEHVLPEYMLLCLEHDFFSGRLSRYYTGATIKHLTGKALAEYPIPLPPVEEQKRILMVVSRLTESIAKLRKRLKVSNQCATALAIAAVSSFTGITTAQEEDEKMKAPQRTGGTG